MCPDSNAYRKTIRIGALAPLSRPGWVEAGVQLLTGLELAARDINEAGGIHGLPIELLVRDTAANPDVAMAAVKDLAQLGIIALAGEYHSIVARAVAAQAVGLGLPFICASAVIDSLVDIPTDLVARLPPPQSRGWRTFADYLLSIGHTKVSVVTQPSAYWAAGASILRAHFEQQGGSLKEVNYASVERSPIGELLLDNGISALLLLVGTPDPAIKIVQSIRKDPHLDRILIAAPAGQPELHDWHASLGKSANGIPFLRYLPARFTSIGDRIWADLNARYSGSASFVGLEGYDAITALANALHLSFEERAHRDNFWACVDVVGTRGRINFSRSPTTNVWEWNDAPIEVAERNSTGVERFRTLFPPGELSGVSIGR